MTSYITAELRRKVIEWAGNCCEYCLIHQDEQFFSFEIDHIISEKHLGTSVFENICLACPDCNAFKGSDIASIDWEVGENALSFLFHPRQQLWTDHFRLNRKTAVIEPLTAIGRVTVFLLQLNQIDRVTDRKLLLDANRYPCKPEAS